MIRSKLYVEFQVKIWDHLFKMYAKFLKKISVRTKWMIPFAISK